MAGADDEEESGEGPRESRGIRFTDDEFNGLKKAAKRQGYRHLADYILDLQKKVIKMAKIEAYMTQMGEKIQGGLREEFSKLLEDHEKKLVGALEVSVKNLLDQYASGG